MTCWRARAGGEISGSGNITGGNILTSGIVSATTSVTGTQPTSSLAKGTNQLLNPVTPPTVTDSQLIGTPAYNQARRNGSTPQEALAIARSASASGTNNYAGTALPGIRTNANTGIVKDDSGVGQ